MIIAKSSEEHSDFEWSDAKAERLFKLLDNTVYSADKKLKYEQQILAGLEEHEYENLKIQFYEDRVDSITMKGVGNQTEIKNRLRKL